MKNFFIMTGLVILVASPAMSISIINSKHDMISSGFATGGGNTEICVFCHTPHGGQISVTQAPLWNNTAATSVNATLYNSATMNYTATVAQINATDARLCLACHDSGVGLPVNLPNSGLIEISTSTFMSTNALLSLDMSNDHPIGMNLGPNPQLVDPNLRTMAEIIDATRFNGNPFYGGPTVNTMWCSSCHDVHDNVNVPFLRMNNDGSALCKACHNK